MKKNIIAYITLAFVSLFYLSCKKQVAGPQGEKGDPGKGTDVYTSDPFTLASSEWTMDSVSWHAVIHTDKVTYDVVTKGVVRLMIQDGNTWWELPYITGREHVTTFGYSEGIIKLEHYSIHGLAEQPKTNVYRYVTMTPSP
jgi:hypothetical protein